MIDVYFFANKPLGSDCLHTLINYQEENKLRIKLVVSPESNLEDNWWGESHIKRIADSRNIKFLHPENFLLDKHVEDDKNEKWLISVQYPDIFNREILNAFGGKTANLHLAPLPRYRGWYGPSHAIIEGRKKYGWTIHEMNEEVDLGNILASGKVLIERRDTAVSLYKRTESSAILGFKDFVDDMVTGRIKPKPMKISKSKNYKRNSLDKFRTINLSDTSPKNVDRILRALYFPPHKLPKLTSNSTPDTLSFTVEN
jgi:methionyl-tRNA formyltransferase